VSERTEPKLLAAKVANTTNCKTSINQATETPAQTLLSLVKKARPRPRTWEVDGSRNRAGLSGLKPSSSLNPQAILCFISCGQCFSHFHPNSETTLVCA
jgi:hypothetical protein